MAILVSRLYVRSNKYRKDVFGLSQSMFAAPLEMIVERGFPLLRRINEILSALRDMGFTSKLFNDFTYNMTILAQIRELKSHLAKRKVVDIEQELNLEDEQRSDESPEVVLTTEHLEGAFTLFFLGFSVSSVVFILEIIFHSKFVRKYCKVFWSKIYCHNVNNQINSKKRKVGKNVKKKKVKFSE